MNKKINCILLVDDNNFSNIFNKKLLGNLNVADHIKTALNGEEALQYILDSNNSEQPYPDLIFLDINMPVMDGWEFLVKYKSLENELKKAVIILLSTSPNPDDMQKAESISELSDFYRKPISKEMMSLIIEKFFSN